VTGGKEMNQGVTWPMRLQQEALRNKLQTNQILHVRRCRKMNGEEVFIFLFFVK